MNAYKLMSIYISFFKKNEKIFTYMKRKIERSIEICIIHIKENCFYFNMHWYKKKLLLIFVKKQFNFQKN